jgi:peptidoglycan hydrolase-like protein with peptidoglycan-binding domain
VPANTSTATSTARITNFTATTPSKLDNATNIYWQASQSTDAELVCNYNASGGSINLYIKEGNRTLSCDEKNGVANYVGQIGNSVSLGARNNTVSVPVTFTLNLLKNGYPTGETRNVTVTFPPAGTVITPTPVSPYLSSATPSTVKVGGTVTLSGSNFNSVGDGLIVILNNKGGTNIWPTSHTDTSLTFVVPSSISPGTYTLQVAENPGLKMSNVVYLTVTSDTYPTPTPGGMFTRNMYRPMSGEDVKRLQGLLGVSPQSGYFGFVTEAAVQNFQCKYNILCAGDPDSTGYGVVGPKTRAKLNEVFGGTASNASQLTAGQIDGLINYANGTKPSTASNSSSEVMNALPQLTASQIEALIKYFNSRPQ